MAIKIFGLTILTSTELASVKSFALSEATKAVAALKETPVGTAIANAISDIDNANLTGIQKFEKVLSDTLPDTPRTVPSARSTFMMSCGVDVSTVELMAAFICGAV